MSDENKWVFVSGGSRGIGAEIVTELTNNDYRVVFTYKNNKKRAEELCNHLNSKGKQCYTYQCDASISKEVNLLAEECISLFGAPYAVINNAGITKDSLFINIEENTWSEIMNNNVLSGYLINKAFLPHMINQGDGCILFISSITAFKGNIGQVNYAASKAAMIGMTHSLAIELGRFNIRVNSIAPGLIETDMTQGLSGSVYKNMIKKIPLGRVGSPKEVAMAVNFLLSCGGNYITGQTLVIDGGMSS